MKMLLNVESFGQCVDAYEAEATPILVTAKYNSYLSSQIDAC